MATSFYFLVVISVLCSFIKQGYPLKCYHCEDLIDVAKDTPEQCYGDLSCVKFIGKSVFTGDVIQKGCFPKNYCDVIHDTNEMAVKFCETCDTDLCNGGYTAPVTTFTIFAGASAYIICDL